MKIKLSRAVLDPPVSVKYKGKFEKGEIVFLGPSGALFGHFPPTEPEKSPVFRISSGRGVRNDAKDSRKTI